MKNTLLGLGLGLLVLLPGASQTAAAADVTFVARVDKKNRVYVDVENDARSSIRVTSVVISFFDRRKKLIDKTTIECNQDCAVGGQDAESFGPIDGPDDWETVKVNNVYYVDAPEEDADEESDEEAEPTAAPSGKASSRSTAPAPAPGNSSPAPVPVPTDGRRESLDGYAEWRKDGLLYVDGQRVRFLQDGKFKGAGAAKSFSQIPLGYEVKAKGRRDQNGVLVADEVEAKENGSALFEADLRSAFDEMEKKYRSERRMYEEGEDGEREDYGRLRTQGPEVARVRGILERMVPGYLRERDFRIYVVENKEWNAMAAPNDSLYIFTGLLNDMDDDEVAIILGHELAHATHEHSRKSFKKGMLIQLAALGVAAIAEETVEGKHTKEVLQVAALLGATAWVNGYGRSHEDQSDRVGLRYAFEAGYDVRKGPALWNRFATKYGDTPKALNFFFGSHSVAKDRARNLTRELALNYSR